MREFLLVSLLCSFVFGFEVIDIKEAKYYYETNSALFIDARDFKKYQKGTIAKAINLPSKRYKRFKKFLPIDKSATIVIFCGGVNCTLSVKLSKKLEKLGYTNIKRFAEGFPKWRALKFPVMAKPTKCKNQKPKKVSVYGVKLVLNQDSSINKEWFNSFLKRDSLPEGVLVVDVRDKSQFKKFHLKGAVNIPFINGKIDTQKLKDAKAIIFYCNSGIVSARAKESLSEELKRKTFIVDDNLNCKEGVCLFE